MSGTALHDIVVVGASLAGVRAVEELRRVGSAAKIHLVGAEADAPYDRPPLSKDYLLGKREDHELGLTDLDAIDVTLHAGRAATGLDLDRRIVTLDDATELSYDGLIIATGARPTMLAGAETPGVQALRTIDDARRIRAAFDSGARVAVVGGGFIGLEAAATARERGLDVTVVEALETPLATAVGPEVGRMLTEWHREQGVTVRCGARVAGFHGGDQLEAIALEGGELIEADLAIVGVGVRPNTEWLEGSGLQLDDGVLCDEHCGALGTTGVYAVGDVARLWHPVLGAPVRIEHWTNAASQATLAARNLLGGTPAEPYRELPYFWSDQYGARLQFTGSHRPGDEFQLVTGELGPAGFAGLYARDGVAVGCVGLRRPAIVMRAMRMLETQPDIQDMVAALAPAGASR